MKENAQKFEVTGEIGVEGGKPVLRVKGLLIPLTTAQLLFILVGGKPPAEAPRCQHTSNHGLPCLKDRGHKDRHHYIKKVFAKKRAAAIDPVGNSASAVHKRRAKGLCAWCDNRPVEGKKLCTDHLVGARKQQRKMVSKRRIA